ncbi:MAG: hypothetical protein AABY07_07365 [Nanoarchaeota archaeon]
MKKSLESLLRPLSWLDKQVLRQYTKIGRKIPERALYKLTLGLYFFSAIGNSSLGRNYLGLSPPLSGFLVGFFTSSDLWLNIDGLMGRLSSVQDDEERVADNPSQESNKRDNRSIRLPVFLAGAGFAGKIAYDIFSYLKNKEPINLSETAKAGMHSLGLLMLASSMYLKDQDPKLLKKDPFWKRAYNAIRERMRSLIPEPIPELIPVRAYSKLEDYVK